MHTSEKTDVGMLPQSQPLESRSADNLRDKNETGFGDLASAGEAGVQHGREERNRRNPEADTRISGEKGIQRVMVLDKRGNPLMPCHPARARELLKKGRAVVVRFVPFMIRLKDRVVEDSIVQPVRLGIDPGSKTTGMALSRDAEGVHHVLFQLEIVHRGEWIRKRMGQRANYRKGRRSRNLRYRKPRFLNRKRKKGWLAPSLYSRVQNIESWVKRLKRWAPVSIIDFELVNFDTQKMQNAEISGVEYQQGTLAGSTIREYLLNKFGRRCVYCGKTNVPLNIDHVIPRSKGGSNRVSNLVLACIPCNQGKGSRSLVEFCPEKAASIQAKAKKSLKDSAAVNITKNVVLDKLQSLGVPVLTATGAQTKFNRSRLGVLKTHSLDAACVGELSGIRSWDAPTLTVKAMGRGLHQRTKPDKYGFPRIYSTRVKRHFGFQTGDAVQAVVPKGRKMGVYVGRASVRARGDFRVGSHDGISHKYCILLQRADGYEYSTSLSIL